MYKSVRSLLLSSVLIFATFAPVCQSAGYDGYGYNNSDCNGTQCYVDQLNQIDQGVAALHLFKEELKKNRGEKELFFWLDTILKNVYYADYGYGLHAYYRGGLVVNILQQMEHAKSTEDKIARLNVIKLKNEVKDLNRSFLDRHAGIFAGVAISAYITAIIHHKQLNVAFSGLGKSVNAFALTAGSNVWDIAKGLCPYVKA